MVGLGQHQAAFAAGEQSGEGVSEGRLNIGVGLREDLLDAGVHVIDDVDQVFARFAQIDQLLGQEGVAFAQRLELFQGQRVDLAQNRQISFGAPQTLLLLAALIRHRLGTLVIGVGDPLGTEQYRNSNLGPIVGQQYLGLQPQFRQGPLGERLDLHLLLGPGEFIAVHRVDHALESPGQLSSALAHCGQFGLGGGSGALGPVTLHLGERPGVDDPGSQPLGRLQHRSGSLGLPTKLLTAGRGLGARVALGLGGPIEPVHPIGERPSPLFGGAQR